MFLSLVSKAYAADPQSTIGVPIPGTSCKGTSSDLMTYIGCIYQFATYLAVGLAILMIMYGGYKLMTSKGDPEALQDAKDTIWGALVGLFLLVFAYLILSLVVPGIVSPI